MPRPQPLGHHPAQEGISAAQFPPSRRRGVPIQQHILGLVEHYGWPFIRGPCIGPL